MYDRKKLISILDEAIEEAIRYLSSVSFDEKWDGKNHTKWGTLYRNIEIRELVAQKDAIADLSNKLSDDLF